ncbi:hypothetical protein SAMN05444274_104330 [Mariniphaga anaerophila]|uniref:Uncharacterized protein n=1 Tax=Mariniphaga anaerophila TaxID=1484053 RepID=A0A1M5AHT8_9BACT|nr:DUF5995 family protein [Mariniphaga anaerophila]SHF29705.1 hypothetical protein SAMN05444274_104330 [Mariniphaga anaerophila]
MNADRIKTIDDVISALKTIVDETEKSNNPLGYFAVLYLTVTVKVKDGIETHYFDDGKRMEQLDIIFAKRYIDAYIAWNRAETVSKSWEKAFKLATNSKMLVIQHLLMGMNAHINLDLGIAAAEISGTGQISHLKNDFFKINKILSSLVEDIQSGLSSIWRPLKKVLAKTGKADNFLVDFSMELARDGAWKFANEVVLLKGSDKQTAILERDVTVARKAKIVTQPTKWIQFLLWIVRLGEKGSVSEKMRKLNSGSTNNGSR